MGNCVLKTGHCPRCVVMSTEQKMINCFPCSSCYATPNTAQDTVSYLCSYAMLLICGKLAVYQDYWVLFDHSCSPAGCQPCCFRGLLLPKFTSLHMSLLNLRGFMLAHFSSMSRFQGMASLLLTVSVMLWPAPTQFTIICRLDEIAVLA